MNTTKRTAAVSLAGAVLALTGATSAQAADLNTTTADTVSASVAAPPTGCLLIGGCPIPIPGLPGFPGLPTLPSLPPLPHLPALPELPVVPAVPDLSAIPPSTS